MIVRELFVNESKCDGCGNCFNNYRNLFGSKTITLPNGTKRTFATILVNPVPPEMKAEAEWAIFDCWMHNGPGAGSALGRGEPETDPPPSRP